MKPFLGEFVTVLLSNGMVQFLNCYLGLVRLPRTHFFHVSQFGKILILTKQKKNLISSSKGLHMHLYLAWISELAVQFFLQLVA